jgi:hypothetical protein
MDKYRRWIALAVMTIGVAPLGGCRICADCEDLAYPAYGGAWERTRRDSGRVGSVFDPAGGQSSMLVDRDEPPTPDSLERQRQEAREGDFEAPDRNLEADSSESNSDLPPGDDKTQELLERQLDDIRDEKEDSLRQKSLDDIDIRVIPRSSVPATLH